MFTGIIQEIGKLINCSNDSMTFASSHLGGVLKGDSIAVNGVCLTVKSIDGNLCLFAENGNIKLRNGNNEILYNIKS